MKRWVAGVKHRSSKLIAVLRSGIKQASSEAAFIDAVYNALEHDDVLAMGFGRLLLWTDPKALPGLNDVDGAWQLYLRTWRPGAYTRGTAEQKAALRKKWGTQAMQEVSKSRLIIYAISALAVATLTWWLIASPRIELAQTHLDHAQQNAVLIRSA